MTNTTPVEAISPLSRLEAAGLAAAQRTWPVETSIPAAAPQHHN